jgi:putative two-component system response regulator
MPNDESTLAILAPLCRDTDCHGQVVRHCVRVGRLAGLLAREVGIDDTTADLIEQAARLHDVGKVSVACELLLKPAQLTEEELQAIRQHTISGEWLLRRDAGGQDAITLDIVRHHHEKWDGTGYPDQLAGEAIPRAARITALADVFDSLTQARAYKRAWSVDEALAEIRIERERHFDPELTDAFLQLVSRLHRAHPDLATYLAELQVPFELDFACLHPPLALAWHSASGAD